MHILISALHRPSKPTGVCRHAANLAQCLADSDEVTKVTLIVGAWQRDYFEKSFTLSSQKIRLVDVNIKNSSLSRNIWFLFGLPKLAKSLNAELVHLSFPIPFINFLFSSPVVSTIHDLYPYECPDNFGYPQVFFNQLFLKICVNNSTGISCVSQTTLKSLEFYFPNISQHKKTTVIYNYVDFSNILSNKLNGIENVTNDFFMLCVAQHRKNKNLDLLIQSYSLLLEHHKLKSSTKLIIVGSSGPETENIHNHIQKFDLQEQVLLLSSINDAELCWLYQNCELFIIPSSTEGFCLPLAEALYLSCKVVCSDIPIFKEVGSSYCTYFSLQENAVENLSKAIIQSLNQPNSNDTSNSSRFSKSNAAIQYLKFYSTMM
jgi:glycosyltransferase involved in cell wall biosynthesis